MTAWAHLPNAVHIDRVLESVLSTPYHWVVSWQVKAHDVAWAATQDSLIDQGKYRVWTTTRDFLIDRGKYTSWDAILALIAFDDCAYMLDSDPSELAILAKFGDCRAVLLLSACKAFHSLKLNA